MIFFTTLVQILGASRVPPIPLTTLHNSSPPSCLIAELIAYPAIQSEKIRMTKRQRTKKKKIGKSARTK